MKKFIALALVVAFVSASLVGCGGSGTTKQTQQSSTGKTESEKTSGAAPK